MYAAMEIGSAIVGEGNKRAAREAKSLVGHA